jgi:hypothetical protein
MNDNKLLLVKGIAGLGNRMFCALTGILYARLTGRRLLIDWRDDIYSNDGSNAFYRFFECSLCNPADQIPETDSVRPSVWRGQIHQFATRMRKPYRNNTEFWLNTSIDLTQLGYQEDLVVMWTFNPQVDLLRCHFNGPFKELSQLTTKKILRQLLREDLLLHPEIRERVNQFKCNHFKKETVGVHVRYTDHRAPLWPILKKLNTLLKHEPELQIFLSTDNIQIKNMFEDIYPLVISAQHWYSAPGLRLHGHETCPHLTESGIEALVDLYLLAECNYLIIDTSSSFSRVAELITKVPDSDIFDVKRREKLPVPLRRLTWKLMLRLGFFSWGLRFLSKFIRLRKP